jgi:1-aminocyclopropane-1-carboxylate deaminase/D-cysteine desulfhydrase-like pyridoxal-dependent ACC family enzyme
MEITVAEKISEFTLAELRQRAARLPRVPLAHLPTPLEELPRFSERLGGPRILIKRDDCTGLLFGGNKTRHNEFILGQAVERGCDTVVWGAGVQSNNCRQTAAACAKLGLACHLVLSTDDGPPEVQGNLLLDYMVGASVEFTDIPLSPKLWEKIGQVAERFLAAGRRTFAINDPAVRAAGTVSYVLGLAELIEQLDARGTRPDAIYVCSCGVTGAGMFLAKKMLGLRCPIISVSPIIWPGDNHAMLADMGNRAAALLGIGPCLSREDISLVTDFLGPGYGRPSPAGMEATRLLAQTEGILLDPVYTAKAMAALVADVRAGKFTRGQNVVFVHTGGTPALFAYQSEYQAEFASHNGG